MRFWSWQGYAQIRCNPRSLVPIMVTFFLFDASGGFKEILAYDTFLTVRSNKPIALYRLVLAIFIGIADDVDPASGCLSVQNCALRSQNAEF